jgi:uncharacterized protein YndB with AHSA1/START domain
MTTKNKLMEDYQGHEFIITREFDAPRELVFQAWTDPRHLAQWWGPRGFTNPVCDWDPRPGKAIHVVMRAPNGVDYPMGGEFREIIAPELLVFTAGALDGQGKMLFEFLHTALFVERKGKTLLTLRSRVTKTTADASKYIGGFEAGMTQSLERLTELLAQNAGPLVIERTFAAPVGLVWEALTDRDKIAEWSFDIKEFKPEVGFKFEMFCGKGAVKYLHLCQITEVIPAKKLAYTWRYEGYPGDSLVTIELFAEDNKTRLKLTHSGLETFPQTDHFDRKNFNQGWNQIIGVSLKAFVENPTADREILISRVFAAPRELVWAAMTDPKQVIHWWGPRGFSTTIEAMDVRPGGEWRHVMQGPDGTNYPNHSVFEEVVKPERIVYTHGGHRENGPSVSFLSTWTFDVVEDGKTKVTIRMVFPSPAEHDRVVKEFGAIEGGKQTLARLGEHLASQPVAA